MSCCCSCRCEKWEKDSGQPKSEKRGESLTLEEIADKVDNMKFLAELRRRVEESKKEPQPPPDSAFNRTSSKTHEDIQDMSQRLHIVEMTLISIVARLNQLAELLTKKESSAPVDEPPVSAR